MKPKTLTLSRGTKLCKNYNTFESHVIYSVELEENDNIDESYEICAQRVSDMIFVDLNSHIDSMNEIVRKRGYQ